MTGRWGFLPVAVPCTAFVGARLGALAMPYGLGFERVPGDVPYVSTYPHNVEDMILALRAMLPDDRLVDLAQIPAGFVGAVATAAIARLHAASPTTAAAAGAAWLVVPAVWLQLP